MRVERQRHAGMLRAEVVGVDGRPIRRVARTAEDDELGQVLVERAQAVVGPAAEARLGLVEAVPAGVDLVLGRVVVVGRPQVADEDEVIDTAGEVRPPIGDRDSRAAMAPPADLHGVDDRVDIADVDLLGRHRAEAGAVQRRVERVGQRRAVERQAGVAIQRGLGVERLDVAVSAREEDPDDRLGPRREVGLRFGGADDAVVGEHAAERQAGEAESEIGEEGAAVVHCVISRLPWRLISGEPAARAKGEPNSDSARPRLAPRARRISPHHHRIVTKSLWFSNARTRPSRLRLPWAVTNSTQSLNSAAVGRRNSTAHTPPPRTAAAPSARRAKRPASRSPRVPARCWSTPAPAAG